MHHLPQSTIKLLSSTQVITSTVSVVKELLENSLDAKATSVEIKLENFGLDKLEVRDNGCGVSKEDVQFMAQPHFTSKITSADDLSTLESYGFRGEALGSLCSVSDVTIVTKTMADDISMEYTIDKRGTIIRSKPSHLGQGTSVIANNIFKDLPVRKQYHNSMKRKKESLKQIEELILAYSAIFPQVRLLLKHNKDVLWQSTPVASTKNVLYKIFGHVVLDQLEYIHKTRDDPHFELEAYLPSKNARPSDVCRSTAERLFIVVNTRPVDMAPLQKMLKQAFTSLHALDTPKFPIGYVHVRTNIKDVDVNLEPNKTKVMLHHQDVLMSFMEEILKELYTENANKNPNLTDNLLLESHDLNQPITEMNDVDQSKICMESCDFKQPIIEKDNEIVDQSQNRIKSCDNNHPIKSDIFNELSFDIFQDEDTDELIKGIVTDEACIGDNNDMYSQASENPNDHLNSKSETSIVIPENETDISVNKLLMNNGDRRIERDEKHQSTETVKQRQLEEFRNVENTNFLTDISTTATNHRVYFSSNSVVSSTPKQSDSPVDGVKHSGNISDYDKIPFLDIDTPEKTVDKDKSLIVWSRGQSLASAAQKTIQPVQILVPQKPNTNPSKPDLELNSPLQETNKLAPGQITLFEAYNSNKINTSAFRHFSMKVKPKLIKENPNASFQEIGDLISQEWQKLSNHEKENHKELADHEAEKAKLGKSFNDSFKANVKRRKVSQSSDKSMLSFTTKTKSLAKSTTKTVTINFSLKTLASKLRNTHNKRGDNDAKSQVKLIGTVESMLLWILYYHGKLMLLQPIRAKEQLIYKHLLNQHALQMEALETPINLNKSMFSKESHWEMLLSLATSPGIWPDYLKQIKDPRIIKNGFKIRHVSSDTLEIIAMTSCINFYGLADLNEILTHIVQSDKTDVCSLVKSRPIKVVYYLQAEAVRMSRSINPKFSTKDCIDLVESLQSDINLFRNQKDSYNIPVLSGAKCFHNRPFLHELYDFVDLPFSQSSQDTLSQI